MCIRDRYNRDMHCHKDDIKVICELLAVRHGDLELDLFSNSILDGFIEFLCTNFFCVGCVYCCTIFIIK